MAIDTIEVPNLIDYFKEHIVLNENHNATEILTLLLVKLEGEAVIRNNSNVQGDIEKNLKTDVVLLDEIHVVSQVTHKCQRGHTWMDPKTFKLTI